jgi:large-conductance mechanosensitive channel
VADMREQGTSFLRASYDFAAKTNVVDLAMRVTSGAAFSTVAPSNVDDVFNHTMRIVVGLDCSDLFVVSCNHTAASVPSLTAAKGEGVAALATA